MRELREVTWPHKFRPDLPEKYDGSINPEEFLQIYTTAIRAAGGSPEVMANYFLVALKGTARSWIMNLPRDSIASWRALCREFIANFSGTCARPGTSNDLHNIREKGGRATAQVHPALQPCPQHCVEYLA